MQLSGVARGCGWQHIGSFVNLVAFYVVGIPVAAGLAFWMRLNGTGLRVGILCGAITQTVCLAIISSRTNWEVEVSFFVYDRIYNICWAPSYTKMSKKSRVWISTRCSMGQASYWALRILPFLQGFCKGQVEQGSG